MELNATAYSPITTDHSKYAHIRARQLRGTMMLAELRLWQAIRANRLQGLRFRRQQPIVGFIVNFYCHSVRLVIEVDGEIHNDMRGRDAERDSVLADLGMTILRFRNEQVYEQLDEVLVQIGRAAYRDSAKNKAP